MLVKQVLPAAGITGPSPMAETGILGAHAGGSVPASLLGLGEKLEKKDVLRGSGKEEGLGCRNKVKDSIFRVE